MTHEETNSGSDRSQLANMPKKAKVVREPKHRRGSQRTLHDLVSKSNLDAADKIAMRDQGIGMIMIKRVTGIPSPKRRSSSPSSNT